MTRNTTPNTTRIARYTGLAYLGIIITGIFAEVGVRMSLIAENDPATTTANIAENALLFRAGILADVAMVSLDVAVAVGLLVLLKHVHKPLAQLAAAFRLIQAATISANQMNMIQAGYLATRGPGGDALGPATEALVLASMEVHGVVYDLGLIFFALSCLVLSRLLYTSRSVPRALALGIGLAGGVYLVGSTVALFAPAWSATLDPLYGVAFIAELAFALWLVIRGMSLPTAGRRQPRE